MDALETCPDCGVELPVADGPVHPYLGGSASCWALYGEILAREYSDPRYMRVHRLTVDAYAAQHPGEAERRSIQSVWVHLAGLFLTLEKGLPPEAVTRVIASITRGSHALPWLEPPRSYAVTVADAVLAADEDMHARIVRRWAQDVWDAWTVHQAPVRALAEAHLSRL
jgi:hypothetical protein